MFDTTAGRITPQQAKDTGMAMVLICLLAGLMRKQDFFLYAAIALLVMTMTRPAIFIPAARVWLAFSDFLGGIVSKILLSFLFAVVVTPIGLIRRLGGADSLRLKMWRQGKGSAFTERNITFSASDLERPY